MSAPVGWLRAPPRQKTDESMHQVKKPFEIFVEGLLVSESGGEGTRIELFIQSLFTERDSLRREILALKS